MKLNDFLSSSLRLLVRISPGQPILKYRKQGQDEGKYVKHVNISRWNQTVSSLVLYKHTIQEKVEQIISLYEWLYLEISIELISN